MADGPVSRLNAAIEAFQSETAANPRFRGLRAELADVSRSAARLPAHLDSDDGAPPREPVENPMSNSRTTRERVRNTFADAMSAGTVPQPSGAGEPTAAQGGQQ